MKQLLILGLICVLGACQSAEKTQAGPADKRLGFEYLPPLPDHVSAAPDSIYANAFKAWDGDWEGIFTIFEDTAGQRNAPVQPRIRDLEALDSLELIVSNQIQVKQGYSSSDPFYQSVNITDLVPDGKGKGTSFKSHGANLIRGNELWCVVIKADETVVHTGTKEKGDVIIWERAIEGKTEYFYEEVKGDTYRIIGWGYYGEDDLTKAPKTWFFGEYRRKNTR